MMRVRRIGIALILLTTVMLQVSDSQPAAAYPSSQVQFVGHGFGHGRGLSQYGAYGYAKDHGWSYSQILDHYYGGTSMGAAGNPGIDVRLVANDDKDLIAISASPYNVDGIALGANVAVRVRRTGTNQFGIDTAPSCAGPWSQIATRSQGQVIVGANNGNQPANGANVSQFLQLCTTGGIYTYRGNLSQLDDGTGHSRAVNKVLLDDYLLGVIPRESPASWGSSGGQEALKAQTVAARSYVLAQPSYPYANTCDTTACQVYGGVAKDGTVWEDSRTNGAVIDTAGQVRKFGNGSIARTEFSSSSGGYTTGGTFPAVVDDGDDVSANPNHTWTANVSVSTIESAYPSIGSLQSIIFNSRNLLGEWGGRVVSMTLVGSNSSVTTSGGAFRNTMGTSTIKSDWFNINYQPSGGVAGYWLMASDGGIFTFGNAQFYGSMGGQHLNKPVVGLTPMPTNAGYWLVASDGGVFSYGDADFHGSMGGEHLNSPVVAMTPTPTGDGYWQVASDGGVFAFGGAKFYGSKGGQPLNRPIVGIAATPSGNGYWLVASDGGIFAYGDALFYGSMGGESLKQPVVGMARSVDGGGYWMVARDGGIFAFGNAPFLGSLPGSKINETVTGMSPTPTGGGYLITSTIGNVHPYGDAPYFGNMASVGPFVGSITGVVRSLQ